MKKIIWTVLVISTLFLASYLAYAFILKDSCEFNFSIKSKNICYYDKAIKENNVETCDKIQEVICYGCDVGPPRMQCYSSVALENNNPLACKKHEEIDRIDAFLRCLEDVATKFPDIEKCGLFPKDEVVLIQDGNEEKQGYNRQEACYYFYIIEQGMFGRTQEEMMDACTKYIANNKKLYLDCKIAIAKSADVITGDYSQRSLFYSYDNNFLCEEIPFKTMLVPGSEPHRNSYYFGPRYAFVSTMSQPHWFWAGREYLKFECYVEALQKELCGIIVMGRSSKTDGPTNCAENILEIAKNVDNLENINILEYPDNLEVYGASFCDKIQNISVEKCKQLYQ